MAVHYAVQIAKTEDCFNSLSLKSLIGYFKIDAGNRFA